jgi:alkylation response protein AidB-like acyl-CoA dehydrogenase
LSFEREVSGETHAEVGGSVDRLVELAQHIGGRDDPRVRAALADLYIGTRVLEMHTRRSATNNALNPTVAGSIGKLLWTRNLQAASALAGTILGPALTADTGAWGTYCWTEHVLGAPGFRIAGGTDEIQRNIVAERGLGLPKEPSPPTADITAAGREP